MKTFSKLGVSLLGVLLLTMLGSAATISYTDYVPGPDGTSFSQFNFSGTFTLPQFDSSLGTLTSVTLEYTAAWQDASASYIWQGEEAGSARVAARFGTVLNGATIAEFVHDDLSGPIMYDSGTQALNPGDPISASSPSGSAGPYTLTILQSVVDNSYAAFIGNGNVTYDLDADMFVNLIGNGSFTNGEQTGSGRGVLTITYTYDLAEVPEPSTMFLLGGGLLLTGLITRFRRTRRN